MRANNKTSSTLTPRKARDPATTYFLISLIVGMLCAFCTAFGRVGQVISVIGPILATVAYGIVAVRLLHPKSGPAPSTERVADNCYYLGFLFTLIALCVSFLPVIALGAEITSQDVLRAFSMALLTTVVGLIFRTLLVQRSSALEESSSEYQYAAAELAESVVTEGQRVQSAMRSWASNVTESSQHGLETVTNILHEQLRPAAHQLAQEVVAATSVLRAEIDRLSNVGQTAHGAVARVGDAANAQSDAIASAVTRFSSAMDNLTESIQSASQRTETAINALSDEVSSATTAARELQSGPRSIEQITTEMRSRMANASEGLSNAANAVQTIASALGEVQSSIGQMAPDALSRLDQRIEGMQGELDATLALATTRLREVATRFVDQLKTVEAELRS